MTPNSAIPSQPQTWGSYPFSYPSSYQGRVEHVTPVVAFYLIYDWHHMIKTVDGWVPVRQRATVRQRGRCKLGIDARRWRRVRWPISIT